MNYAMEIHDSSLLDIHHAKEGNSSLLFRASIYRSKDVLFQDHDYESGFQNVRFGFLNMRIEGNIDVTEEPYATDGSFRVNNDHCENMINLPADHVGDICLELRLSPNFTVTRIYASKIWSNLEGEFELEYLWKNGNPETPPATK